MTLDFNISLRRFSVAQYGIISFTLVLATASYIIASTTGHFRMLGLMRLLDVGSEQSIPTYVSTVNLILASILIFVIYLYEKSRQHSGAGNWLILSLLFLFLSVDEGASIHEMFTEVNDFLAARDLISPTLQAHQWLPFGVLFLGVCLIILIPLLRQLPRDTLRRFLLAGGIFVMGAVGFEYLGDVMLETGMVDSKRDPAYLARRIFEEAFEMYGIVMFNCALYFEIQRRDISIVLRF